MRNKVFSTYITIFFCFFSGLASCKKDSAKLKVSTQTINVTIKDNEDYKYNLGSLGDEDGLTINRQATHFEKSLITLDTTSGNLIFIYEYEPSLNFLGTDEVEIKHSTGSNGSSANNIVNLTTLKFTITN